MSQFYYFIADFDKIQRYIFQTNKLREMVGASELVAEVTNREVKEALLKPENRFGKGNLKAGMNPPEFDDTVSIAAPDTEWELIYADGGNVKALFKRKETAEKFEAVLQRLFNERLGIGAGTFTAVTKCFDSTVVRLGQVAEGVERELKTKKVTKSEQLNAVTTPFFRICSSCGLRESEQEGEEENEWLCQVCALKRRQEERGWVFRDFADSLEVALRQQRGDSLPKKVTFPKDFEELAAPSDNFLGVVVLDGNRMGEVVMKVLNQVGGTLAEQIQRLRKFSRSATRLSYECVTEAIAEAFKGDCGAADKEFTPAFRPIILGGDDIVFVLQADRALGVARRCCEFFESGTERLQQQGIFPCKVTFAAGVVIVKKGFPFFASHALAEALVRSAKRKNRRVLREEGKDYSTLDFLVLTSSDVSSLTAIREKEMQYQDPLTRGECLLTGKPYLLRAGHRADYFNTLVVASQWLRSTLPSNKQQALRTVMRQGEIESQGQINQMLVRVGKEQREKFVEQLRGLGGVWREEWLDGRPVKVNQFLDMLELIKFYGPARQRPAGML